MDEQSLKMLKIECIHNTLYHIPIETTQLFQHGHINGCLPNNNLHPHLHRSHIMHFRYHLSEYSPTIKLYLPKPIHTRYLYLLSFNHLISFRLIQGHPPRLIMCFATEFSNIQIVLEAHHRIQQSIGRSNNNLGNLPSFRVELHYLPRVIPTGIHQHSLGVHLPNVPDTHFFP